MTLPPPGLYAITDAELTCGRGLVACVEAALRGGAVMVQYRDKRAPCPARLEEARQLAQACRRAGVAFIVNDDVALARDTGADGVHLGREDPSVAHGRDLLGRDAIIGVSCYHELERAMAAEAAGASYVAFGRFFPSRTKPGRPLATVDLLREASRRLTLPIAAIGGITPDNGHDLVAAGARWLAVIHDLWAGDDCEGRARAFSRCFE